MVSAENSEESKTAIISLEMREVGVSGSAIRAALGGLSAVVSNMLTSLEWLRLS